MFLNQLRYELWKLFGKKRTYMGFAMFFVAQVVILMVFRFSRASRGMGDLLETNGYDITSFLSPLTADRKTTRLNSSHLTQSRMPSSA